MKVFQDFISKLDSTEKRESNFGNLCMKKFVPKREVFISFKIFNGGEVDPRTPLVDVRTPLVPSVPMFLAQQKKSIKM